MINHHFLLFCWALLLLPSHASTSFGVHTHPVHHGAAGALCLPGAVCLPWQWWLGSLLWWTDSCPSLEGKVYSLETWFPQHHRRLCWVPLVTRNSLSHLYIHRSVYVCCKLPPPFSGWVWQADAWVSLFGRALKKVLVLSISVYHHKRSLGGGRIQDHPDRLSGCSRWNVGWHPLNLRANDDLSVPVSSWNLGKNTLKHCMTYKYDTVMLELKYIFSLHLTFAWKTTPIWES